MLKADTSIQVFVYVSHVYLPRTKEGHVSKHKIGHPKNSTIEEQLLKIEQNHISVYL